MLLLPLALALQQSLPLTTPPSGDTVGYWQQRASYRIAVRLDERTQAAHASGTLTYVNHSPDTLREMFVYQYLNAYRPGSVWSAADEREGRVRFQHLADPDFAYERFTEVPAFDGVPVRPSYPYAPDSTVARFALPRALAPGDSLAVRFAWDARPSATVYRRQGRLGRHYDFAQWYPKVAVYDRGGWEVTPMAPNGELYGEFGTFDVTIIAADDQVLAATGVPVEGDPGWERVRRFGTVTIPRNAYGVLPPGPGVTLASGERAVRFYARDIHHFAWTASPDYLYEGGMFRDSIPVHALYEPRDSAGWGRGAAVDKQKRALAWLESIYGRYPYPQVMGIERIDPGSTEFPMLVMYGSAAPSYELVLHEVGHIYTYGILANNEWKSAWMDEGLTTYQSRWAQNATAPERARGLGPPDPPPPAGYRGHALRPPAWQQTQITLFALDLTGRAEPIGTSANEFNEYGIYTAMVYARADMMYGALRDVLGDSTFRAFLRDYYARWQLKHVDELAMRASAERVSGRQLGWFFAQWVHHTGLVDYALRDVRVDSGAAGWTASGTLARRGSYLHPMTMRVDDGRDTAAVTATVADSSGRGQRLSVTVPQRPSRVSLDPSHLTPDWDARDDHEAHATRFVFGWPFLDQWDRYRSIAAISPQAWYTGPGGLTLGARLRSNYQRLVDLWDAGLVMAVRGPGPSTLPQAQGWLAVDNPRLPWSDRPAMGLRTGAWMVDGTFRFTLRQKWDESPFRYSNGARDTLTLALNVTSPYDRAWQDTLRWSDQTVADVSAEWKWRSRRPALWQARAYFVGGLAFPRAGTPSEGAFGRAEAEAGVTLPLAVDGRLALMLRGFGGVSNAAPPERSIGLSSLDPTQTFDDNFVRGRDAILVLPDVHYVALGGAGLRGFSLYTRVTNVAAANTQVAFTLNAPRAGAFMPRVQVAAFADGAYAALADSTDSPAQWFGDAGASVILHGALYDKAYVLRVDLPIWMTDPALAPGTAQSAERVKLRWTFTLADLW
jgi:hypothetical protein